VDHGVPVVPARPLGITHACAASGPPNGVLPQRGVLPSHVKQPVPKRFAHLHLHGL
jgi:hypothetical protein